MSICYEFYVLSGRGLCDGPIPRPEESYRLCCVFVCDLETSNKAALACGGLLCQWEKGRYSLFRRFRKIE
jgi:hypothetical protein